MGMLLTYIDQPRTLLRAMWPDTPIPLRQRWASQIRETLAKLHEAGIVWGDAKAENVLIDWENNAWVTDFGGGYTMGWVDAEKAGTVEGDLQGLARILDLLNREDNATD
jgi:serine/threonine protein kinase